MGQVGLPIVEIANCNGDRQAGPKRLLWRWRTAKVLLYSPGLSTGREPHWHPGGQCDQLKHQDKLETIGWRSCY
jgi:hypothetical protein